MAKNVPITRSFRFVTESRVRVCVDNREDWKRDSECVWLPKNVKRKK